MWKLMPLSQERALVVFVYASHQSKSLERNFCSALGRYVRLCDLWCSAFLSLLGVIVVKSYWDVHNCCNYAFAHNYCNCAFAHNYCNWAFPGLSINTLSISLLHPCLNFFAYSEFSLRDSLVNRLKVRFADKHL